MRAKQIKVHLVKHMYMAYAKKFLVENPDCFGTYHHKIKNYYIYKQTSEGKTKKVFDYDRFRTIVEQFFHRAKTAVIRGDAISINKCGYICAKRVERDFRRKRQRQIDWGKTRQQEMVWDEEKQRMVYKKIVYYTTDDWCRIAWYKPRLKHEKFYEFEPTNASSGSTTTGFKREFSNALRADPLLKFKYLYVEIRNYHHNNETVEP